MKLDEGILDQRLSLDITPLIDIVFLLVLFFAVSTSFISGEDLDKLKTTLSALTTDKIQLSTQIAQQTQTIGELQGDLEKAQGDARDLRSVVATLQQRSLTLKAKLDDTSAERTSLEQQLKNSLQDYDSLSLQLESVKTEKQRQAEKDRLLRSLLAERTKEKERIEQHATALDAQVKSAADAYAVLAAQIETAKDAQAKQIEKERLLQALLAEKAAKYENQKVLLVKADQRIADLESRTSDLVGENRGLADANRNLRVENGDLAARNQDLTVENGNLAGKNRRLTLNNGDLTGRSRNQARRIAALETTVLRLKADLAKFQEVAKLDKAQVEKIIQAQRRLENGLGPLLQENKVGIKREKQRLVLQLSNKILFDSGSAALKSAGLEVLRTVGNIIKSRITTLDVQIGGHTDNVPIVSRHGPLSSNWGLSAARAVNVVRFLEKEVGLDPGRLQAVGYGEHRPIAANDTKEGRALNRRIEIVLVPR